MNRIALATLLLCVSSLLGCSNPPAEMAANSRLDPVASAPIDVPPKQLVEQIKQVVSTPPLSLGVEVQERGVIQTGWKRYEGDFHIARHWQERTRYRIQVVPDWDEPAGKSKVQVIAETEQRAAEGQKWDTEPRVPRPQRAQEVLDQIVQQVKGQGAK